MLSPALTLAVVKLEVQCNNLHGHLESKGIVDLLAPSLGQQPIGFFLRYWLNRAGVRVHNVNRSCSAALIQRHRVRTACSQRNLCLCSQRPAHQVSPPSIARRLAGARYQLDF